MLHLEHLNLVVNDIPQTLSFYQAAFPHWAVRGGGQNDWYGKPRSWVHFGDDYQYLAFNDNGVGENRDLKGHQVGLAHFAFATNDIKGVITRLQEAGFEIAVDGAEDKYRENVYFIDPNGYEVEFVEYVSDIPSERNRY
jgi:catechol 2,3-dioxygenase-like lactoylglutathione lyase family enzyme